MRKRISKAILVSMLFMAFYISGVVIAQVAPPTITGVVPDRGEAGDTVDIVGSGFRREEDEGGGFILPRVEFATETTDVTWISSSRLRVVVPTIFTRFQGFVHVWVTNPFDTVSGFGDDAFFYLFAPVVDAGGNKSADEGETVTINAAFSDRLNDTHDAVFDWGDGTSSPGITGPLTEDGFRAVTGSHVYEDDDDYTVTLTVTDQDGASGSDTLIARIDNERPDVERISDQDSEEGDPTISVDVEFTDPGGDDTHTLTVDWDDGSPPEVIDPAKSPVTIEHTYPGDDGFYSVRVTVEDDDGDDDARSFNVTITNEDPFLPGTNNQITTEGNSTITVDINFIDPGALDTHVLTINWGDGSPPEDFIPSGSPATIIHTYPSDDGQFLVNVTIKDDDGGSHNSEFVVILTNEAPEIVPVDDQTIRECDPTLDLSVRFIDAGTEDIHTATINWGDGTQTEANVSETVIADHVVGTVTGSHTYFGNDKVYTVTVTVMDDDGGTDSLLIGVTVINDNPVIDEQLSDLTVLECDPTVDILVNFSDCSTINTYAAAIDWGDGTRTQGTILRRIDLSGGIISGRHTYPKDNDVYTVTVTLTDNDEGEDTGSFNVIINNEAPVITDEPLDLTVSECDPTADIEVNFSDCSDLDRHTARVDWGDGTLTEALVVAGETLGVVTDSHTYPAFDNTYTVTVLIVDDDEGSVSTSFTVTVENDAPVIGPGLEDLVISECEPVLDLQVDFTDCGVEDTHRAMIDWGDGTQSLGEISEAVVDGGVEGVINANHTYAGDDALGENAYTVNVTLQDNDGGSHFQSFVVTIENADPIFGVELENLTLLECDPTLDLRVPFTDCSQLDTHTATIDWGDGTSSTTDVDEMVIGNHTYIQDDASYVVTVTVQDDDGGSDSQSFTVTVQNNNPVIDIELEDLTLIECDPTVDIRVLFSDCSQLDTHTAVIDWGDGTQTPGIVSEEVVPEGVLGTLTGSHTYIQDDGVYIVTVTVADDDGGNSSESFTVTVENERPTISTRPQELRFAECDPTVNIRMDFEDCSPLDTHTAIIFWDDGTQTPGIVSREVGPDGVSGTVTGSHTYTRGDPSDPETYNITVTVTDDDGGDRSRGFTAVAEDTGPSIETDLPNLTLTECDPTVDIQVSFTNCNAQDTHTAVIDWGDGTQTPGEVSEEIISEIIPGIFVTLPEAVSETISGIAIGSHTYAQGGNVYTATVTIQDSSGGSNSSSFTVTVENDGLVIETQLQGLTLTECDPTVDLQVDFTNCNIESTHTALIDWGDETETPGDVSQEITANAVTGAVTSSHTYVKDDGQYVVTVTISDDDGASRSESFNVTVENERPTIESPTPNLTLTECDPTIDFQMEFRDCSSLDTHTVIIDWGDETLTNGTVTETVGPDGVSGIVTDRHTYTKDDGSYRVLVTLADDDGGERFRAFDVTVENGIPVLEVGESSLTVTECDPTVDLQVGFNDCGPLDTQVAVIDWGDGTQTDGTVTGTVVPEGVSGTVTGSHIYTKDNEGYTVTVTMTDDDGGEVSEVIQVIVENEPPVIRTAPQDLTLIECEPVVDFQLEFSACTPLDTHTATVDWGDGTQTPGIVIENVVSESVIGTVTGSHAYIRDDGVYTVTVTVVDDDGGNSSESFTVTVENERPTIPTKSRDIRFAECDPAVEIQMDFADCGSQDTHTAVILWGDGTQTQGIVSEAIGQDGVVGTVTGSHTYTRDDPSAPEIYSITVTVTDDDGGDRSRGFTATVMNEGPVIEPSLSDLNLTEGDPTVDLRISFSDCSPLATHIATVNWGDDQEEVINPAVSPIPVNHTYRRDNGDYVVNVVVTDNDGLSSEDFFTVTVANVIPVVTAGADQTLDQGDSVVINASFTDVGLLDTHTASINWGDGTVEDGQLEETDGSGTVTGSHRYNNTTSRTVTVTVIDDDGGSGFDSIAVKFVPAPVVTSVSPNRVIAPGGTRVTIRGRNFQNRARARIGNTFATSVVFGSSTSITATTPPGPVGAVNVSVINPDDQTGILTRGLTYTAIAAISILPQSAVVKTGQTQPFTVSGEDSVGNPYPVTNADVNWGVADSNIGAINSNGLFTAADFGATAVTAILKSNSSIRDDATVEVPDTEPPEVLSKDLFPNSQNENVPITAGFPISFSEPINPGSVEDGGITVTGEDGRDIEGEFTFDSASGILTFTPDEPFKDEETIIVTITTGVEDLAGNRLLRQLRMVFTTGISVWAGDSNNDGIVNIWDIIPLGRHWGETGPDRDPESVNWEILPVTAWSPDSAAAYADTNGDGEVNEGDILPIAINWQLSHAPNQLAPPQTTSDTSLSNDPEMLNIYQAMYEILEAAPVENEGVRALRSALLEQVMNLKRQLLPHESRLLQNFPNPFNPETWIPYQLAEDAHVRINIYNVNGALVRTIRVGQRPSGYYVSKEGAIYWDGRNRAGEQVSSGIYFCHLQAGSSESMIKLTINR